MLKNPFDPRKTIRHQSMRAMRMQHEAQEKLFTRVTKLAIRTLALIWLIDLIYRGVFNG